jgi:hypothetical protein
MHELDQILVSATQSIREEYFQLPIDGREEPIYRERVYCYELYHQMRCNWPNGSSFTLSGEVDKSGHPLIRGNGLDRAKPDFLVHVPGDMGGNHAVIEVKPINAQRGGLKKDLITLTAFRRYASYERALYLFYGGGAIKNIIAQLQDLADKDRGKSIDLSLIEFWWQGVANEPAHWLARGGGE